MKKTSVFAGVFAAAVSLISIAGAASAATLSPGYDADFTGDVGVRYKSFGNTGSNEHYLGVPDLGVGANRSEQGFSWTSGPTDFTFVIDLDNNVIKSTLGSSPELTYGYAGSPSINALHIQAVDRDGQGEAWLTNLVVNGDVIGGITSPGDEGWMDFMVTGLESVNLFTITGTINLSGGFGNSSESSKIQILAGSLPVSEVPVPAALPLLLAGIGGLGVMARRRRKSA